MLGRKDDRLTRAAAEIYAQCKSIGVDVRKETRRARCFAIGLIKDKQLAIVCQ